MMNVSHPRRFGLPCGILASLALIGSALLAEEEIDFVRDIRPILSDKCFACHGPDEATRDGGFRLDQKESAFGAADSGEPLIVPGKPEESVLIARITHADEDLRMPPVESTKQLTSTEIQLIRDWIVAGAHWQEHWSFATPIKAPLPKVQDQAWPLTPVDFFILARLEREKLRPTEAADKVTLIRRVTLDLTGLPPTIEEVDAFLADGSPDAYEKLVDRLLRSPRYGEHMARFWLDAARYGDTHGLHLDNYREMWPYRDWVVKAFNDNVPYDQFTIEQLAGDLLPNPSLDQLVATGFNRAHVTTNEGGSITEEVFTRNVVDRVVTTGTVFLGMTFECTRCHDHKFDPFTMNDFYALFGYFNSLDGSPLDGNRKDHAPVARVPSAEQQQQLDKHDDQIAALETKLREPWAEVDAQQVAWEQELIAQASAEETQNADLLSFGDWYTVGPFSENRRYLFRKQQGPEGKPIDLTDQFELETGEKVGWVKRPEWTDGKPHGGLPGEVAGNFLYRTIHAPSSRKLTISLGSDDAIKVYLNNKQVLAKDVERGVAADQDKLELALKKGDNHLLLKVMNYGGASGFYFAADAAQATLPQEVLVAARVEAGCRSPEQQQHLREFFRNKVASYEPLEQARAELVKLQNERAEVDRQVATTLIWREANEPRPAYYLKRGEYDQRGDEIARRTPASLPSMDPDLPNNRLGLAKWLLDPTHPLTARVAVNRFWQQVFGTGLVKTAEDFGSQGEPPSHPQLLDWLAVQFIEEGWDVKAMLKRLVMSATYRQSSRVTTELYDRDRNNRLLARGPRFRLDAEVLRDQALATSGLLVERLGGPSVKPPQPDGLWFAVGYSGSNTVRFVADKGHDRVHRRTLYTFIKRTAPPPQMSIIDAPNRESCVVRRERTNTPLQALLLLNDPQYVEAARALAQRTLHAGGDSIAERAEYMFRLCTCRRPSESELSELVAGVEADLMVYRQDVEAAKKLIAVGEEGQLGDEDASELAAWTMTANLVLNLDEVLNKN